MRRQDVRYLALEGLVVLFGVLFALLVDRVREERVQQDAADAAVQRLVVEVTQNLGELRDLKSVVQSRLSRLQALKGVAQPGGLSELLSQFEGFRTPDLSEGAWNRLSSSGAASSVDPDILMQAFYLYEWNRQFDQLDDEISRLVYSELFYSPERRSTALAISERIMGQELAWADEAIPHFEQFLAQVEGSEAMRFR